MNSRREGSTVGFMIRVLVIDLGAFVVKYIVNLTSKFSRYIDIHKHAKLRRVIF